MEKKLYLIVGLGNPGEEYAHTRHNAGFDVTEKLEEKWNVKLRKKLLLQGETAEITDGERKIVICRPLTFMNASGECVKKLVKWYNCPLDHLLVIYDDIDLAPGRLRMRKGGGPGTHNGMRSIVECLGSQDFPRLRVGTGDRPAGQDLVSWVLGRYPAEERAGMEETFRLAAECAEDWIRNGLDHATQKATLGTKV